MVLKENAALAGCLIVFLSAATGCARGGEPLPEKAEPSLGQILTERRSQGTPNIDALSEDDREALRKVFNDYFSQVRGFMLVHSLRREDFDKTMPDRLSRVAQQCRGKGVEWIMDFFGKPTRIQALDRNRIILMYRVGRTDTVDLFFREGKLVSIGEGSLNVGLYPHDKLRRLAWQAVREKKDIEDLSQDQRGEFRRAFNEHFGRMRNPPHPVASAKESDEIIEDAFLALVSLCKGKSSEFVLDFFGKPAWAGLVEENTVRLRYRLRVGKKVSLSFHTRSGLQTVSVNGGRAELISQ